MRIRALTAALVLGGAIAIAASTPQQSSQSTPPAPKPLKSKTVSAEQRLDALARAQVWMSPPPIAKANLGDDPKQPKEITCTFEISQLGGTAPKFDCKTPSGER